VKPNFVDGIKDQLRNSPIGSDLFWAAADIIDTADSKEKLGMMRRSLRGARGLSTGDAKQYRQQLFAAASMDILQDAGYETPVVVVKGEVECLSDAATPPAIARANAILHQLTTYRDHLIDQEGRAVATAVFERAIEIARAMGEPILEGDDWLDPNDPGELTNHPASVVAGRAIMVAMDSLDMPDTSVSELHSRYPVDNLETFRVRRGSQTRDDVEEEA